MVLGFRSQSFPTDFLEMLRWDINAVLIHLGKRESLASPLAGLEGKGENNATGDSTAAQGSETVEYRH